MIWLAIIALCGVSFVFAGIEAGLLSLDPVRLRSHVKQKTRGAERGSAVSARAGEARGLLPRRTPPRIWSSLAAEIAPPSTSVAPPVWT